jgi:hypothetical protein
VHFARRRLRGCDARLRLPLAADRWPLAAAGRGSSVEAPSLSAPCSLARDAVLHDTCIERS